MAQLLVIESRNGLKDTEQFLDGLAFTLLRLFWSGTKPTLLFLTAVTTLAGCQTQEDSIATAAILAVDDVLPRAPEGYVPYLATDWQIPGESVLEPLPDDLMEELQRASGLPLASDGLAASRDSAAIVLYLFRPLIVRPDSVIVLVGWMGLVGGDGGGAWGNEYVYRIDCHRQCRIVGEPRESSWN